MWPIAVDVTHHMVCVSVCLCVGHKDAKMAEPIMMSLFFGGCVTALIE